MSSASPDFSTGELVAALTGPQAPLRMTEMAAVVGGLRTVELALFSWLGHVAPSLEVPHEVAWASAASLRAAWRVAQLDPLLPVSAGIAVTAMTRPADPVMNALEVLVTAGHAAVPETTARWYGTLRSVYDRRIAYLSPAADGPLERVLGRVRADLEAEIQAAEAVCERPGRGA